MPGELNLDEWCERAAAERIVLGVMMLSARAVERVLDGGLEPEHLTFRSHRLICRSIMRLRRSGVPVDALTVTSDLQRHMALTAAGGERGVDDIANSVPAVLSVASSLEAITSRPSAAK